MCRRLFAESQCQFVGGGDLGQTGIHSRLGGRHIRARVAPLQELRAIGVELFVEPRADTLVG